MVLTMDPETGRHHRNLAAEEHFTITQEPAGVYMTHFTPARAEKGAKPAKQQAQSLYDWLVEHGVGQTLAVIGEDATASMSGHKGGMLAHLENMPGRPCFAVMCCLYINELPLRHLVAELNGPTSSAKGWTGPVGKTLSQVNSMTSLQSFEPIPQLEPLVSLPEDTLKDMSTDSAAKCGVLELELSQQTGRQSLPLSVAHHRPVLPPTLHVCQP